MHGRMGCEVSRPMGLRLVESLAQDRADGAGAASAFRAAAEAAIDLGRGAGTARPRLQARAHLSVGEDVARADDHAGYRKPVVPVGSRPRRGRRSLGLSDHSHRPWPRKPADLGRSQIRMIEKSKLFRTLAAGRAAGQERRARFISAQSVAGSWLPSLVRDKRGAGIGFSLRLRGGAPQPLPVRHASAAAQCAISTGTLACDRIWLVGPPKIICRSRLWV